MDISGSLCLLGMTVTWIAAMAFFWFHDWQRAIVCLMVFAAVWLFGRILVE
jgi:hypothetical protein